MVFLFSRITRYEELFILPLVLFAHVLCQAPTVAGKPVSLRLQGPLNANGSGRVEVFYNGQWGTICDDGWDIRDARVVCHQLGYPDAVKSLRWGQVPSGSGRIWLYNVACTGREQNISSCSHPGWGNHSCTHSEDAGVECNTTDKIVAVKSVTLRLQEPSSVNGAGRVEVLHNGEWGTICDDGWDIKDARVVCRQLGYSDAVSALEAGQVPSGSGRIWLSHVGCTGKEQDITNCTHDGWGRNYCRHYEDAGVQCFTTAVAGKPVSLRLQGPLSVNGTGRVEVFYNGQWGTICDDGWDIRDARVVCRQLGYPDVVSALQGGQVPSGSGRIWLYNVACTGKEQNISSCSHPGWGNQNCRHPEDAGVECTTTVPTGKPAPLRIQGPLSANGTGRVEVFYKGEWGTICDDDWDINDARVACRQIGYPGVVRSLRGYQVPSGSGPIWLDDVSCTGEEQDITSCSHDGWGNNDCRHYEDAGVECSTTDIFSPTMRLQGPLSANGTGRVEVLHNGQWGTICDDNWDIEDARVVCRQLGYPDVVRALYWNQVPSGFGRIWLNYVACIGNEQNISSCSHNGWGIHNCRHSEDAGVECSTREAIAPLRLIGLFSADGKGRVEVLHNGHWGTICDDGWDIKDARVVCRQLGYLDAVRSLQGGQVPPGFGDIWLDEVACTGKEQNISSCSHPGWGNHYCTHYQDVGVECNATDKAWTLRLQGPLSANGTGRVEVFYEGQWQTICDDGWDINDAIVVCRQLGFPDAVRSLRGNQVPSGTGQILLDNVACSGVEQNIRKCYYGWGNHNCSHSTNAGVECSTTVLAGRSGSLRLQGPLSADGKGRVEVFYNGHWGTICDNRWDINDATVVCRQLGYPDVVRSLRGDQVPSGSGPIWLDNLDCTGREQNLTDCSHSGWGSGYDYCTHFEDAGVECRTTVKPASLRLRGPSSANGAGRVEVLYNGEWGTICDDGWDIKDARVVCRQFGYPDAVRSLHSKQVPSGSRRIWLSHVGCTGKEQDITNCTHDDWGHHSCTHLEDAGVQCSTTVLVGKPVPLRLQGPLSAKGTGRVEVLYNGQWGTICDADWDMNEARVACRQLGYLDAVRAFKGHQVPSGSGHIWLFGVTCTGREKNLTNCSYRDWGSGDIYCSHFEDAGVECILAVAGKPGSLRLQGPLSENGTGRVELLYNRQWGRICADNWDVEDARVACRQLGYIDAVSALHGRQVPSGYGRIWLGDVTCTGKEQNITSCSHPGWGNHSCRHSNEAGVECSRTVLTGNSWPLRLRGPLSANGTGRVEILYNGQWGTICGFWGIRNTRVACRQLGYADAVRSLQARQVPSGSGRIWLAAVSCTGKEQNITSCAHTGWGNHYCGHSEDVGVECSTTVVSGKPVLLRLQGPLSARGTGRVEVFYNGRWGTICDHDWNMRDARVACRQLGYPDVLRPLRAPQVPPGSGRIWLHVVTCTGNEKKLSNCSNSGWGQGDRFCLHSSDVGVECMPVAKGKPGSIRLQGPLSANGTGRVEVVYDGLWGTICHDGWDIKDARVVCRQLGYPDAFRSLQGNKVPSGLGRIWLRDVACTGEEQNITSCPHDDWGGHGCTHSQDAGVECSTTVVSGKPVSLRLQGPLSADGKGRVEVFFNGHWGTICDDGWDIKAARVVCRQLGYPDAVGSLAWNQVPSGSGRIWLDDVVCNGREQHITSCSHKPWGNHDCTHSEDAGVECNTTVERNFFLVFLLVNNYHGDVLVMTNVSGQLENFDLKPRKTVVKSKIWKSKKTLAVSAVDADTNQTVNINGQAVIHLEPTIKESISLQVLRIEAPKTLDRNIARP